MPVATSKKPASKAKSHIDAPKRFVSATEFKAKCLGILDQIEETGESLTITRRGKPVATIGPAKKERRKSLSGCLAGKVKITGDIINTSDLWEWNPHKFDDLL